MRGTLVANGLMLRTLGPAGVGRSWTGPLVVTNRRTVALLCILSFDHGKTERDALARLLWGETGPTGQRKLGALLQDLRALDPDLADLVGEDGGEIAVLSSGLQSDLDRISAVLGAGTVPDVMMSTPRLATRILSGLDGITPDFAQWVADLRLRTAQRWMTLLSHGATNDLLDFPVRHAMAEAAQLLDPFDQAAARNAMALSAATGNITRARQVLDRLTARLAADGLAPDPATLALARGLPEQGPMSPAVVARAGAKRRYYHQRPDTGQPVVAVLPFTLIGGNEGESSLRTMLAEDIINRLSTQRDVAVMSGNTTMGFSESTPRLYEKLHKMGADYALLGSLHRHAGALHLTVRLTDTQSSVVQTVVRRDISRENLQTVQNIVSTGVVNAIVPGLQDVELRLSQDVSIDELTVYQIVLQARREIFRLERDAFERAGDLLQEATQRDPLYAPAYLNLADWHSLRIGQGWSDDPDGDQARLVEAALRAIKLGGWVSRAYAVLGHNKAIFERAYPEAEVLFEHALDLAPHDPETLLWTTPTAAFTGRAELARERMERAIALTPHDPLYFRYEHFLAVALYACRDPHEAVRHAKGSRQKNPKYTANLRLLAAALAEQGDTDEARQVAADLLALEPGFSVKAFEARSPIVDQALLGAYGAALRLAGLPD
ncbi:tetratricopeptide repeat protein [Anianabacter salinae]|uniref:tetratricopeptide repeat protein n=1 Tax=Anianabacter salinae TaxID=2851023 RepID=UPI00225DCE8A|nr:hypothetical protein [Anianabacter salinae]MBV0911128.1 tetratricopeptide repeat protein [Anianabacter salinae]